MNYRKNIFYILVVVTSYIALSGSCLPKHFIYTKAQFLGTTQELAVSDSTVLKILQGQIPTTLKAYDNQNLDNALVHKIATEYSLDAATIYTLNRLYEMPQNKEAQNSYSRFLNTLKQKRVPEEVEALQSKYFLFIPGFAYKEDPTTGADLARQRELLTSYGVPNKLIETEEYGLVDDNAQVIANTIAKISKTHNDVVLVSASKGGLETAIALGKILDDEQTKNVSAWVSVGGILRGSPIADRYLKGPNRLFAGFMLWTKGHKMEVVKDISHAMRSQTYNDLKFPKHIQKIHFVGVPLTAQVHKRIKGRYCAIQKKYGPNDGLTTIPDALTPGGIVVSELGLDHYFKDDAIDLKTLALACLLGK